MWSMGIVAMEEKYIMKKQIILILPFIIIPVFIPIYAILDNLFLVDIFGCGCVPSAQTNMLNIPYNANNLRSTVFSVLTVILSIYGFKLSKNLNCKPFKVIYCIAIIVFNSLLTIWFVNTFMWK